MQPDISILIPLLNEAESLPELSSLIMSVMDDHDYSYEVIFIDDGSSDESWEVIQNIIKENQAFKAIKFRRNYGKSAALNVGFEEASGRVVITMDADLQDNPLEIPALYDLIVKEKYDLVSGWKKKRHDPPIKTIPSKFFNMVTRKMSGISLHDFNCGLKAYRSEVVKNIEVYGEMHRYIPVIAKQAGFSKIGEKVVHHQERKYGTTKFGWERFIRGFLDILSITFVTRFGKRPMHFFGTWGFLMFLIGFLVLLYLTIEKIFFDVGGIATRPLFFFGLILLIIGAQFFATGFMAELVSRNAPDRNIYHIDTRIGL